MEYSIELKHEPSERDRQLIFDLLERYNDLHAGPEPERPLALLLRGKVTSEVCGGVWGLSYYRWLFLELLFVPENLRGRGFGRRLMCEAEAEATRRGCHGVWLETFSFQARGFYEKLGYRIFGVVPDYPPGQCRFFMLKRL